MSANLGMIMTGGGHAEELLLCDAARTFYPLPNR